MTSLSELERLARAATPGPWHITQCIPENGKFYDSHPLVATSPDDDGRRIAACDGVLRTHENAAYIAAASPDVVLALISRIRELEAEIESRNQGEIEANEYD